MAECINSINHPAITSKRMTLGADVIISATLHIQWKVQSLELIKPQALSTVILKYRHFVCALNTVLYLV